MSYDENRISDLIDNGIHNEKQLYEDLVNSHSVLFRRLNQINNNNPYELHNKSIDEAKRVISLLSNNKQNERILQSENTKPSYKELTDMLQDCVNLLNEIHIDDCWFETYSNVIMNAETMLFKITE